MEVGTRSETGYLRNDSQDRMSGTLVPLGRLFLVADGMGGHKGGALAAQLVVQELQHYLEQAVDVPVEEAIGSAFRQANATVYRQAHADPAGDGMGATAVLLLVSGGGARVAHVGDSRGYLYRSGILRQLTSDDAVEDAGILKQDEAPPHSGGHLPVRAMGEGPEVDVHIGHELAVEEGDAFLLCSDGLSRYVPRQVIEAVLRSSGSAQQIAERLVELALERGGPDNVTVQLIRFGHPKAAGGRGTRC